MATRPAENMKIEQQPMNTDHHLPHDIVRDHILTRIPLKFQLRFGLVSKLWYNSIHTILFNSIHHNFLVHQESQNGITYTSELVMHDEDYGTTASEAVGSCDGLFSVFRALSHEDANFSFSIFDNSINQEQKHMITMTLNMGTVKAYGFGFDSLTREHNVVLIQDDPRAGLLCNVYTIDRTNLSRVGSPSLSIKLSSIVRSPLSEDSKSAIIWNQSFCWMTRNPREMLLLGLHEEKKFRVLTIHDPTTSN